MISPEPVLSIHSGYCLVLQEKESEKESEKEGMIVRLFLADRVALRRVGPENILGRREA